MKLFARTVAVLLLLCAPLLAAELVNVSGASRAALSGYDPVAFFTDSRPVNGVERAGGYSAAELSRRLVLVTARSPTKVRKSTSGDSFWNESLAPVRRRARCGATEGFALNRFRWL